MVEKLGQIECCIFTLTMLPSKVLRKKVRFTIGARASNSAAGQKFMLKGLSLSLSLLYCKLQPAMYKRMAALVSYRLLEFLSHRCYSRPTNLPDFWRLPSFRSEINPPPIVGIALSIIREQRNYGRIKISFLSS